MWFKNLQIYRLTAPFALAPEQLDEKLAAKAFQPGSSVEMQRMGWMSPRDNGTLVHAVGGQMLITLRTEKKLLPATVINQVAKARAQEIEEKQGYKPGRKEMRELKDSVTNELLPRAFAIWRDTQVWIDPVKGPHRRRRRRQCQGRRGDAAAERVRRTAGRTPAADRAVTGVGDDLLAGRRRSARGLQHRPGHRAPFQHPIQGHRALCASRARSGRPAPSHRSRQAVHPPGAELDGPCFIHADREPRGEACRPAGRADPRTTTAAATKPSASTPISR
jgi:hypothetical protein